MVTSTLLNDIDNTKYPPCAALQQLVKQKEQNTSNTLFYFVCKINFST